MSTYTNTDKKSKNSAGFTIIELLIVIVVVGVLAAITAVSYQGIQQRTNNSAIISTASQALKILQSYVATTDSYPTVLTSCLTLTTGCITYTPGNTAFHNALDTIATLPTSAPRASSARYGILYLYSATRTVNGQVQPAVITYYLQGTNNNCGLRAVVSPGSNDSYISSTTGYTNGDLGGTTQCVVSVPGPSV